MSLSTSMGCEDAPNDDDEKSRFIVRRPDCGCFGLNMLASDVDPVTVWSQQISNENASVLACQAHVIRVEETRRKCGATDL
jgi:hypothetical protein